jgi:hypothetical protein
VTALRKHQGSPEKLPAMPSARFIGLRLFPARRQKRRKALDCNSGSFSMVLQRNCSERNVSMISLKLLGCPFGISEQV